ncbi:MAG: hypothetical protein EOM37_03515 [Proteobacteria bacterium]|nr:hypothetical protein [Pseudomonadota bacterium]
MRFLSFKTALLVCSAFMLSSQAVYGQHDFHEPPDIPVPAPQPVQVPTLPPQIPTAPLQIPVAVPSETKPLSEAEARAQAFAEEIQKDKENAEKLKEKMAKSEAAYNELSKASSKTYEALKAYYNLLTSGAFGSFSFEMYGPGSLQGAKTSLGSNQSGLKRQQDELAVVEALLAGMDESHPSYKSTMRWRQACLNAIKYHEEQIVYWSGEVERIQPLMDKYLDLRGEFEQALTASNKAYAQFDADRKSYQQETSKIFKKETEARLDAIKMKQEETQRKKDELNALIQAKKNEQKKWPSESEAKTVSTMDLSPDEDVYKETQKVAGETAGVGENKTYQELLEQSQADAFEELFYADASYKVLRTADVVGQGTQMAIGFVPGLSVADTALAGARGFAESIGQSIADGVSVNDAIKAAALNAGYTATINFVGNKLTAGADKYANRVVVLSEVGFSKLTTKQVAEMGAKGFTFAVIKTTQQVTGMVVDAEGRQLAQEMDKSKPGDSGSSSPGFGGYGMSTATRPLAQY